MPDTLHTTTPEDAHRYYRWTLARAGASRQLTNPHLADLLDDLAAEELDETTHAILAESADRIRRMAHTLASL